MWDWGFESHKKTMVNSKFCAHTEARLQGPAGRPDRQLAGGSARMKNLHGFRSCLSWCAVGSLNDKNRNYKFRGMAHVAGFRIQAIASLLAMIT